MKHQRQPFFILATYITIIIPSLLFYVYKFTSINIYNKITAIISLLNPELYNEDFYIQEMTQFTPRFYYYNLIYWGVKLGISLPWVCFILYLIAFSSFLIGLYSLGRIFNQSRLSATVFTFLGFAATVNGRIGFADLFRSDPIPATLAMGLVIWGFYFCFCHKWILGYLFFGLTCLLQFLVGALPGMLMTIPLLLAVRKNKNFQQIFFSFFVLGICVCLIYIPMLLSGNTNSGSISNEEFVYLYGYIRHPHHLIFSGFGLGTSRGWLNFILFTIGGLLCIQSSQSLDKDLKLSLNAIVLISCLLLIINYIFVEVYPIDLIAKLQFARTTPFAQLMILLVISVLVEEEYRKGNIAIAFLLIIAPILRGAGILLLILGVSLWLRDREARVDQSPNNFIIFSWGLISILFLALSFQRYFIIVLFILTFLTTAWYHRTTDIQNIISKPVIKFLSLGTLLITMPLRFFPTGIIVSLYFLLWVGWQNNQVNPRKLKSISIFLFVVFMILYKHYDLLLFGAIALPLLLNNLFSSHKQIKNITFSLAILFSLYFSLNLLRVLPPSLANLFQQRIRIGAIADNDVAILAQEFKQLSPEDSLVLVPPLDEEFRFYSLRAIVFSFKSFPFTDEGINLWRDRLKTIAKLKDFNNFSKYTLNDFYGQHSNDEIITIAKKFNANYILTRRDWHQNLDGSAIAQQGDWIIYQISGN
ncbi:MAG: DUF6798 domain-containing protein [Xenococcus sp. (in: cyanobacteria)]